MIDPDLAKRITVAARKGRDWIKRRDELIIAALDSGATQVEVAKLAGLTQPAVSNIANRDSRTASGQ